jgi:hypothetical protein
VYTSQCEYEIHSKCVMLCVVSCEYRPATAAAAAAILLLLL